MCGVMGIFGIQSGVIVAFTSVLFGLAHVHHILGEFSAISVLVMFIYTSLFAAYSAFVFLATANVYALVITHIFCNFMQLPDFGALVNHRRKWFLRVCYLIGLGTFVSLIFFGIMDPLRYRSPYFVD
jgi:nitrate/nitrite transporter NarK